MASACHLQVCGVRNDVCNGALASSQGKHVILSQPVTLHSYSWTPGMQINVGDSIQFGHSFFVVPSSLSSAARQEAPSEYSFPGKSCTVF